MKKILIMSLIVFASSVTLHCQTITYYNSIREIFTKSCVSCHSPNGTAPFSLKNLDQIIAHKGIIRSVVEKSIMPPWKPDPNYSHFVGERVLSISDKQKIITWIQQDCLAGTPSYVTKNDSDTQSNKTAFADVVLKLPYPIKIAASKIDTNIWVEMPYEIERDTFISSYEFAAGFGSGIHHVFISIQSTEGVVNSFGTEARLEGLFWDGKDFRERSFSSRYLAFAGGWISGQSPYIIPSGMGWLIPKKGFLVYQLHYGPTPVSFTSYFELRLRYAKNSIDRIVSTQKYGSQSGLVEPYPPLVVPPDTVMSFTLTGPMDTDYSIIAVGPHMHLLGKSFKAWLLKANGDTIRLINIKDWDFNQQGYYFLPKLLKANKGDLVQFQVVLDNTSQNLNNPNKPPKFVLSGNDTKDEMIQLCLLLVPYKKDDELLNIKEDD